MRDVEMVEHVTGYERGAGGIEVTVAVAALLGDIELQRHPKRQLVFGPGHRHVEQAAPGAQALTSVPSTEK